MTRSYVWAAKKEFDKALSDCNEAVKLDPKNAEAVNSLAWLEATCPDERYRDGKNAVANALYAVQLCGGKDAECADTLAAAYAQSGDFAKAREWETKAIGLTVDEKRKQEYRLRLELYKRGKPYRMEAK